jgi:hypothetical protein
MLALFSLSLVLHLAPFNHALTKTYGQTINCSSLFAERVVPLPSHGAKLYALEPAPLTIGDIIMPIHADLDKNYHV